jgi:PAS domain S-box-containing protein
MTTASTSPGETDSEAKRALQIIESMPGHAWSADATGRFTYVSPNTLAFLGNAREDLNIPDDEDEFGWRRVVHPDDYDRVAARWRHCLETGDHYDTEHRLRRADGVYRWFRNSGRPSRDSQGRITQWYGTTMDIDDQKRAEAALRDREREFSQLVDMVPSHLWRLTPDGEPTFFNKRMVDFLGLDVADTDRPGMSRLDAIIETVHPDDAAKFRDALNRCLVTGESFAMRYRLRRADGVYRWMSSRAEPLRDEDGRIVQWYGLCHDIDDQVHAEENLQKSERRYRDLFHYMPIGLTQVDASKLVPLFKELRARGVTDLQTYIDEHPEFLPRALEALEVEEVNQHTIEMFGARNAEEMRGPITRYWQPGISTIRRSIEARYRGEEVFQEETKVARMDGGVVDVLFTTARPGAVADKSLVGFIDITERKKAEEALRDREREFSQLVEMVPSLIWRLSPEGEPTFLSKRLRNFLGTAIADAEKPGMGRLAAIIEGAIHPDDADSLKEALNHSFVTGERFSKKFRLRRADGVYRWMEGSAEPLRDESGRIVQWYGLSRDIDDQVHAEEALSRLRQMQSDFAHMNRVSTMGELAASLSHEITQPIASARNNARAAQNFLDIQPPDLGEVREALACIVGDADRAGAIIDRIRKQMKKAPPRKECFDLNAAIDEMIALARSVTTEKAVSVQTRFANGLGLVEGDRVQLQQVILNLILNAVEAIKAVEMGPRELLISTQQDGTEIVVAVRDTGPGIDPKQLERVFEAFYTTKPSGTGMGLSICRSIIDAHGGRLWAEPNEPRGAVFQFTLPGAEARS